MIEIERCEGGNIFIPERLANKLTSLLSRYLKFLCSGRALNQRRADHTPKTLESGLNQGQNLRWRKNASFWNM